jgi:hypothetical protein
VYGFKYLRSDLQNELLSRLRADGIVFDTDPDGFIVVHSNDQHHRLEALRVAIDERIFGKTWSYSTESLDWYEKRRDEYVSGNVPYIEYETISDPPDDWKLRPGTPRVWHLYCLTMRDDFPEGEKPWLRKPKASG